MRNETAVGGGIVPGPGMRSGGPAAEPEQALWTRSEGDGDYVTIRVPCPEGEQLSWAQTRKLCVRYADTGSR